MTTPRPTLYLHVGTRKSGTSLLQLSMRRLADALLAQGVATPFKDWPDHRRALGDPAFACVGDGEDALAARAQLRKSASRCTEPGTPRVLASLERLAPLDPEQIGVLAECFADLDLHIVVTARHWGSALPSEWQQGVKERVVGVPFVEFLEQIRAGEGAQAELFRRRHDVPDIARRWGSVVGDDHVTILPLPPTVSDPDLLPRRFYGVLGVDSSQFTFPARTVNPSLSHAASEALRRINLAMGDRLPPAADEHPQLAYRNFMQGILTEHDGPTARVPAEHRGWVTEAGRRQAEALRSGPWNVVGDVDDLIPQHWPEEVPGPSEDEIAAIAVEVAADLAVRAARAAASPEEAPVAPPQPRAHLAARIRGKGRRT